MALADASNFVAHRPHALHTGQEKTAGSSSYDHRRFHNRPAALASPITLPRKKQGNTGGPRTVDRGTSLLYRQTKPEQSGDPYCKRSW